MIDWDRHAREELRTWEGVSIEQARKAYEGGQIWRIQRGSQGLEVSRAKDGPGEMSEQKVHRAREFLLEVLEEGDELYLDSIEIRDRDMPGVPVFSQCSTHGTRTCFWPDLHTTIALQLELEAELRAVSEARPPWSEQIDKAVFRASTVYKARTKLIECAEAWPHVDAVWGFKSPNTRRKNGNPKGRHGPLMTRAEQLGFRYQIVCIGFQAMWWKLASGSPCIVVESKGIPYLHWRTRFFVPWIHYVPSNVEQVGERVEWLQRHPDHAQRIGRNARERAWELTQAGAKEYAKALLRRYREIVRW